MAQVLETDTEIDIHGTLALLLDEATGLDEAATHYPLHRSGLEGLLEVFLERRERTACVMGEAFQVEVNGVVAVHEGFKDSGVERDSLWITSKLWPNEYGEGKTLKAIERMLGRLGLDYIDLVYFHQPMGDFVGGWKEMEMALSMGMVRAIGISNFDTNDSLFDQLIASAKVKPQIMQIECHPYAQRKHWQERCAAEGIQIECWFPLGGRDSKGEILRDPVINEIAQAHGKSAAQVIIRWHMQEGFSVIPGSSNPAHIKENIDVLDFALSNVEMQRIRALDKEARYFNMPYEQQVKWFSGWNPTD